MLFPKSCASQKTLHGCSFQHSLSRVPSLLQRRSSPQHSQFRPHTINVDKLNIKLFTDDVVLHERLNTTGKWPSRRNSFKLLTGTQTGGNAKVDPCVQVAVNTNCCNWIEHDPQIYHAQNCTFNWINHDPHAILCTEQHIFLAPAAATGSSTMIHIIYYAQNCTLF